MKRGLLIVLALVLVTAIAFPAVGYSGGHHGNGWGYAGVAAGGLLVGAVIGSAMAHPVYYAPPPPPPPPRVYYYAPAPAQVYYYHPAPRHGHHRHHGDDD